MRESRKKIGVGEGGGGPTTVDWVSRWGGWAILLKNYNLDLRKLIFLSGGGGSGPPWPLPLRDLHLDFITNNMLAFMYNFCPYYQWISLTRWIHFWRIQMQFKIVHKIFGFFSYLFIKKIQTILHRLKNWWLMLQYMFCMT